MRFSGDWESGGFTGAGGQASALEAMPQADSAVQAPTPQATDAPKAADWKQDVAALGVDPGWVVALRQQLVESGKVDMKDIQADALADPEHRKWLNRQMRKSKEEAAAASAQQTATTTAASAAGAAKPIEPASGPAVATGPKKPVPSVLKPGHMPTGPIWQSTATPAAGGGWIPAQDGLWWPPWPVSGGPIAKPLVQDATRQANALDSMTGQARPEQNGG